MEPKPNACPLFAEASKGAERTEVAAVFLQVDRVGHEVFCSCINSSLNTRTSEMCEAMFCGPEKINTPQKSVHVWVLKTNNSVLRSAMT